MVWSQTKHRMVSFISMFDVCKSIYPRLEETPRIESVQTYFEHKLTAKRSG